MNERTKEIKDLQGDDLIRWIKSRPPLFTDSVELDGMSLCFINPELVEEEATEEEQPKPADKGCASA